MILDWVFLGEWRGASSGDSAQHVENAQTLFSLLGNVKLFAK
jgi:hypothetical protein